MNLSAKSFIAVLENENLKYDLEEREDNTVVTCIMQAKNTSVAVRIFIDNDNSHVAIRCFGFAKANSEKFANALLLCNKCNLEYRWVKFAIDDDMDINAEDDAVVSPETAGKEIFELFIRMISIVDDVYPAFMKAIWA